MREVTDLLRPGTHLARGYVFLSGSVLEPLVVRRRTASGARHLVDEHHTFAIRQLCELLV
ncbi:hypothetical protein D3C76_1871400 [compost metagenome]